MMNTKQTNHTKAKAPPPVCLGTANSAIGPEEKASLYTLGYTLYTQGKYKDALPCFMLLTLHQPDNAAYYAALAACQKMTEEYEKAIDNYATALLINPEQLDYVVHIAECQIAAHYIQGAKNTLNRLLALDIREKIDAENILQKAQALLALLEVKHS